VFALCSYALTAESIDSRTRLPLDIQLQASIEGAMSLRMLALALLLPLAPAAAFAQTAAQPRPAGQPQPAAQPQPGWLYRGSDLPVDPAWRFGTLANGVHYAVRRNARPAGQVSIRVRIAAGSLHEQPHELGWAHLVEHLAFRGSANFADREARHIWQQLGASFGSDTNAFTGTTQTSYQLDLPNADRAKLDRSLHVMADMMSSALFDPAAVEAERAIVIAEKERRSELSVRVGEAGRRLFLNGLTIADRETIGTEETLRGADAARLRAFYQKWYRPERATVVMVGDMDPQAMVELIEARFAGWRGQGPVPTEPDYGRLADPPARVSSVAYPGAPNNVLVGWSRPYRPRPQSRAEQRLELEEALALTIINRRLERRARGESPFISAGVSGSEHPGTADITQLAVTARGNNWQGAVTEAFSIIADALRAAPSAAEIERELTNLRSAGKAAVEGEPTLSSQAFANRLVNAVDEREVVMSAAAGLALFEAWAPEMTPARVAAATQRLFGGARPRLLLLSPEPVQGGATALSTALAAAERAAPAGRGDDRLVSFDALPAPGPAGREIGRERIEDLDVTIVRFANGSTLTFKSTKFDEGRVFARLRFGSGLTGLDPAKPSLGWAAGFVGPSGVADLDLDAMERLLTGRRIGLSFGIDEDAVILSGATNSADLPDQLRLLTAKLTHPRWDPALFRRFQTSALESYELQFSTASGRGQRELPALIRPNDRRFQPLSREELSATTPEALQGYYAPRLAQGPVHAVIVGDVTLERAVEAMRTTVAALPARTTPPPPADPRSSLPPKPNPEPARFTHTGDPSQAFAAIGWSTVGGSADIKLRRALALAGNIIQVRMFDRLREQEGATYSPSATHSASEAFPNWGILYAAAEVRPDRVPVFFRVAREVVAELAARPVQADEFARAQNPVVSGIERRLATNGYWLDALERFTADPRQIAEVRSYLADYSGLTPEDVRRAVAAHVTDEGDWSMVVLPSRAAPASPAAK
jgi:zinc protease